MKNDLEQFDPGQFQSDWRDPELTRLFAERSGPLPDHEFMPGLIERLVHVRRKEWWQRTLSLIFGAGAASSAVYWLFESDVWRDVVPTVLTSPNIPSLSDPREFSALLESPIAWAVCGVLLGAMLPTIYVWRALKR